MIPKETMRLKLWRGERRVSGLLSLFRWLFVEKATLLHNQVFTLEASR